MRCFPLDVAEWEKGHQRTPCRERAQARGIHLCVWMNSRDALEEEVIGRRRRLAPVEGNNR